MAQRITKDDHVKIIAGPLKGTTGKVQAIFPKKGIALIEGIGKRTRHVKPNQLNPRGSTKEVQVGVSVHKLALIIDEKAAKTSRVGYVRKTEGGKARLARQAKNKEIK